MRPSVTALLLPLVASAPVAAQSGRPVGDGAASDSGAVVAVAEAFHRALARADTATVERLLAPGVLVLEAGGVEDRSEYVAHHLPADMAFAAAVPAQGRLERVEVRGDVAWVVSTSHRRGTFEGRPVNSAGAELMLLARAAEGWKIEALHWSSRRVQPAEDP